MKRSITILSAALLCLMLINGCSKENKEEKTTPVERFDAYVEKWDEQHFTDMYDYLSDEAADEYSAEDFVDRYETIYEDLDVEKLDITYEDLDEETLDHAMEDGEAEIPFSVEMETIGGPIEFDYQALLRKEEKVENDDNDDAEWYVDWDQGFIFPELKDGGEVELNWDSPERGSIYDRNDEPLATNDTIHEITIVPEQMGDNEEQTKEKTADLLDIDVETIDAKLDQDWVEPDLGVPIQKIQGADDKLLAKFDDIDGILIDEITGRVYPQEEATAHLTGFIGEIQEEDLEDIEEDDEVYSDEDMIGKRGLEELYENELRGEQGVQIAVTYDENEENEENGSDGNEEKRDAVLAEKPAEDGEDIHTTIDVDVQEEIFDSYDGDAGTSAAIDPVTGETLALVSSPAFNPHDRLYETSSEKWEELSEDSDEPLLNRFAATFAPGSSIKPITAAIGLENGVIDPEEELEIKGTEWSKGESWGDYTVKRVSENNENVDLHDALIESDNIYFAMQTVEMGGEKFTEGLEAYGFGDALPYEYPIENSEVSSSGELDEEVMLANAGYGQGELQISTLHLAATYTTLLNDGNMLEPTLLSSEDTETIWEEELLTSDEAKMIREDLRQIVESSSGTATKAQEADFPISGKTGTAELKRTEEDSGQENGWFVGYPTDDEDILIAMMIEDTEDEGGSVYAVEKVTDILEQLND